MHDKFNSVSDYQNRGKLTGNGVLVIPDGVTEIGTGEFRGRTDIKSIIIPDSVTSIGDEAFKGCTGLTDITIPEGVVSVGRYAFQGCKSLTGITIPASLIVIEGYAFDGCVSLKEIPVSGNSRSYVSADGVLFSKDMKTLVAFPPGKTGEYSIPDGVSSIRKGAFYGCNGLTSVNIPDGVLDIGLWAFKECGGLKSLTIPSSVKKIGNGAFADCVSLETITVPAGIMTMGYYVFEGCSSLIRIIVSKKNGEQCQDQIIREILFSDSCFFRKGVEPVTHSEDSVFRRTPFPMKVQILISM